MSADEPSQPESHRRRPRYRGTHPRRFAEKYKEHAPELHVDTVAKVLAAGKTPAGMHVPIMVADVLDVLAPGPGMTGVDATLGYGGHAAAILPLLAPGGRLVGMDADPLQLPRAERRLRGLAVDGVELVAVRSNFAGIAKVAADFGPLDFVFADLGCSSMQLDDPVRGFSFKSSGPLDMRMNPAKGESARAWLARCGVEVLARVLRDNADLDAADELAAALAGCDLPGTLDLAAAVRGCLGARRGGVACDEQERVVRLVFQALRIEVNDEFGALDALLRVLPGVLAPGGRAAFLTFHSGEDRRVKKAIQAGMAQQVYAPGEVPLLVAGPEERRANPRAGSAKLRWLRRGP